MTRPARIPYCAWPRGLSADQAAPYVGLSTNKFREEVKAGLWPKPETRGGWKIWDRHRLDEAWDRRQETGGDPFMEALDDSEA